jgi:iron complex transport system permease protein
MGSVEVSWHEIAEVITGHVSDGLVYNIVWELRLPRICAAMLLGGALAVSGFMLQVYFNNPIAGPFVLGISSGAKMAVALVMIIFSGAAVSMTSASLIISAFAGAMISMGMILLISRVIHNMYMLIVGGIMIGYICTAVTDFLVTFADDSNIVNLHNWSVGSFSGITWDNVHVMSVVVIAAVAAVFMMSKQTEAFLLGEDYARSMGVNLKLYKTSVILLSSLLSACVAAYAGPVSFVGIAVPHIVKRMLGTAKPIIVMPACFLCGAVFCLGCDLIARMAFAPVEVNISSVTAVFGAPVVLYVLIKKKR